MAGKQKQVSVSNQITAIAVASIMLAIASITNCFSILSFGTFIVYIAAIIIEMVAVIKLKNESPTYKKAFTLTMLVLIFYLLGMIFDMFSQTFFTKLAELLALVCLSLIDVMLVLSINDSLSIQGADSLVSFGKVVFVINMSLTVIGLILRVIEMFPISDLAYAILYYVVAFVDVISYILFAVYSIRAERSL